MLLRKRQLHLSVTGVLFLRHFGSLGWHRSFWNMINCVGNIKTWRNWKKRRLGLSWTHSHRFPCQGRRCKHSRTLKYTVTSQSNAVSSSREVRGTEGFSSSWLVSQNRKIWRLLLRKWRLGREKPIWRWQDVVNQDELWVRTPGVQGSLARWP